MEYLGQFSVFFLYFYFAISAHLCSQFTNFNLITTHYFLEYIVIPFLVLVCAPCSLSHMKVSDKSFVNEYSTKNPNKTNNVSVYAWNYSFSNFSYNLLLVVSRIVVVVALCVFILLSMVNLQMCKVSPFDCFTVFPD